MREVRGINRGDEKNGGEAKLFALYFCANFVFRIGNQLFCGHKKVWGTASLHFPSLPCCIGCKVCSPPPSFAFFSALHPSKIANFTKKRPGFFFFIFFLSFVGVFLHTPHPSFLLPISFSPHPPPPSSIFGPHFFFAHCGRASLP